MANGCLFALFGLSGNDQRAKARGSQMGEGEIHSGPSGYEGMGYAEGYAAEHRRIDEPRENNHEEFGESEHGH